MKVITAQYRFGPFSLDAARGDLRRDGNRVAAGAQPLALLAALLARAGALVTKDDLMQAAWPGVTVEEGNISVQVHRLRQVLQDDKKPYRWIATESGRGYRFIGAVETESRDQPSPAPNTARLAPIIGRERELAALQAMMPGHRLVTVTGPGGMGKTRLALEFAAEHEADPLNDILFLSLEGLRQKDQILIRLAARLGLQLSDGPQLARNLIEALHRQPCLMVFDNCEHLLGEVAAIAGTILTRAPGVSILATSREPLRLAEELVFPLGPLDVPRDEAALTAEDIGHFAAVRLFTEQARTGDSALVIDRESAQLVAKICRRLEGIPLALQLAAAGLQELSLPGLLEGLSARRPPRLSAPPGVPARHRTVEATIAWSVSLLSDVERTALRRLGVFAGDFTPQSAASVIADAMISPLEIPDLITRLFEKSLLVSGAAGRFRLLESTRAFARDMLEAEGQTARFRQALAAHMVEVFGHARESWQDEDAETWVNQHEHDIENLRAALDWAFGPGGSLPIATQLAARLRAAFSDRLITISEYLAAVAAARETLAPDAAGQDAGWIWFSAAHDLSAGMAPAVACLSKAMAAFRAAGSPAGLGLSASRAAVLLIMGGAPGDARLYLDEAVAVLPSLPANRYRSAILLNVATGKAMLGGDENFSAARDYFETALVLARKFRDHSQIAMIGANLAELDAVLGQYGSAIQRSKGLAHESRTRRDWRRLSFVLANSVNHYLLADDVDGARAAWLEAIPLVIELAEPHWITDYGGNLALMAAWRGDFETAAKLAGFSAAYYGSSAKPRQAIEQRIWDRLSAALDEAALSGVLPDCERRGRMREGAALSFGEALAIGRRICESPS
jgi:predicted ATPase/DNA-binding winged helix-turn-helix (wHTH) protein